jgi:hypothetical protein
VNFETVLVAPAHRAFFKEFLLGGGGGRASAPVAALRGGGRHPRK